MRKIVTLIILFMITVNVNPLIANAQDKPTFISVDGKSSIINDPTTFQPDKMSYKNGTWAQLTTTAFTPDGNITEWEIEGIIPETIYGSTVYIAYDATNVYVALIWINVEVNDEMSHWNKTNSQEGYEILRGEDDVITVGFSNDTYRDLWTWTASNRTQDNYAYEYGGGLYDRDPDSGNLPYIKNSNSSELDYWNPDVPLYDNDSVAIVDHSSIPVNTIIKCWLEDTPTNSQTDVEIGVIHNGTAYIAEFVRALDTGNADDIVLDLTKNDIKFEIRNIEKDNALYFDDWTDTYLVFHENTPAELTMYAVPSVVNDALLLQGTAFDDYERFEVSIWMDSWVDTWGSLDYIYVNTITGAWSYLLQSNEMDMPLGTNNITITLDAPYEDEISVNCTTTFEDVYAPTINGVVNVTQRYPTGVPLDEEYVTVSVGLDDNYNDVNNLSANLYYKIDNGFFILQPMDQSYPDSLLFSANISIDSGLDPLVAHTYTYYIEAFDLSNNVIFSDNYSFLTLIDLGPTPVTGITFSSIIGSLLFTGCLVIIVRYI
ncbi:MAG: hypothetical protein ACTSQN_15370 [Candidatus Heimdallarchaeota archaeon]